MKTALIFGSSGLIGNELFKTILLKNTYSKIKIFVRTVPEVDNPKVEIIKTDFTNLEQYKRWYGLDDQVIDIIKVEILDSNDRYVRIPKLADPHNILRDDTEASDDTLT